MKIEELRAKAIKDLEVPGFEEGETLIFKVKKASLMGLVTQGKVPNHLLGVAMEMMGQKRDKKAKKEEKSEAEELKEAAQLVELYCRLCMVEPTYEEMEDILTDEQYQAIFDFGINGVTKLADFRKDREDGTNNNDGRALPEKAE